MFQPANTRGVYQLNGVFQAKVREPVEFLSYCSSLLVMGKVRMDQCHGNPPTLTLLAIY